MIRFKVTEPCAVKMTVADAVVVETGGGDIEPYLGAYDITPDLAAQTLVTRGKRMLDDVRVQEIPYHEVSNAADGTTAIIGGTEYYGIQ